MELEARWACGLDTTLVCSIQVCSHSLNVPTPCQRIKATHYQQRPAGSLKKCICGLASELPRAWQAHLVHASRQREAWLESKVAGVELQAVERSQAPVVSAAARRGRHSGPCRCGGICKKLLPASHRRLRPDWVDGVVEGGGRRGRACRGWQVHDRWHTGCERTTVPRKAAFSARCWPILLRFAAFAVPSQLSLLNSYQG